MRRLLLATLALVSCSTTPEPRHVVVRENDPQMVHYSPGDRVDVIMDRRYSDVNDAFNRCETMGGTFKAVGFVCEHVERL